MVETKMNSPFGEKLIFLPKDKLKEIEGVLAEIAKKKAEEEKFKRIVKRYKNSPLARHTIREELTYSTRIEKHLESIKSHDDENEILSMKMREDMLYE